MARTARPLGRQAPGAGLLVAGALAACANIEAPPGGPPDAAPPAVIQVRPESGAVVPRWDGPAVIRFDEVIEEMPDQLARHVLLSPVRGPVAVSWHRTRIEVEPKEGWKPGRVYRLELLAGITDLRRNRLDSGRTVIFSTGPALPGARLQGTALHWTEQRALGRALIQAALRPDTVPYLALADSSGAFTLSGIPPGDYLVYAVHDQNTNRQRDPREAYDSALVRVDSTAMVVLWAFVHDTTAPRLKAAEAVDSVSVRVEFTQYLDPERPVDPAQVRLVALPDSTPVRLAAVLTPRAFDSVRARERAAADSARRAERDTAAAGRREPRREAAPEELRAAPETSGVRRLLSRRPAPADRVVVRTAEPLAPESRYLVRVEGVRNLSGVTGGGQILLLTPRSTPADTGRAP